MSTIETVAEVFQPDPIYREIDSNGLLDDFIKWTALFWLFAKESTKLYSTKEAAALLGDGVKEHRLTNTLSREDLFGYFQVERKGASSRYLYDWKAIFRLKMVFLLVDEANFKLVDIATLIHPLISSQIETTESEVSNEMVEQLQEKIEALMEEVDKLKKQQEKGDTIEEERERKWQSTLEKMKQDQQILESLLEEQAKSYHQMMESTVGDFNKKLAALHHSIELKIGSLYLSQIRGYTVLGDILSEYITGQITKKGLLSRYISVPPSNESFKELLTKLDEECDFLKTEVSQLNVDEDELYRHLDKKGWIIY